MKAHRNSANKSSTPAPASQAPAADSTPSDNSAEAAVCTLDIFGIITGWNDAAEQLYGYPVEEILGKHFSIFYPADEFASGRPLQLLTLAHKNGRAAAEGWRMTKDGTQIWVNVVITPTHDDKGQLTGFQKITRDISQRKQHEKALEQSIKDLAELKAAIDEHAIVAITDRQGRITYANDRFCAISKFPREELIGKTHRVINSGYHPKDFFVNLWKTISSGKVWRGEIKNRAKDGTPYWVDSTIVPFLGEDGRPQQYIAIRYDITRRKELEEQLVIARDQALQASQLKSEFLANISHEIRTPMNGVIGMNSLLLATDLQPNQRKMAQMVKTSAENLMLIISDILDFSKIEAGKLRLDIAETDIAQIITESVELMQPRAEAKKLKFTHELIGPFERYVQADGGRIRQIVLNLLGNALKFTDKGEITLSAWCWEERGNRRRVRFEVRDSGIGISRAAQRRLFQPFMQVQPEHQLKIGGTGLGLAICKQLIDLMGGEIGVQSSEGRGSNFWFELVLPVGDVISAAKKSSTAAAALPARSTTVPALSIHPFKNAHADEKAPGLKLLLAEDNPTNQMVAQQMLEWIGHRVVVASNGDDAWQELSKQKFDGVIMDCQMPVVDGYEATRKIRASKAPFREIPIIGLTAYAGPEDRERCLKAGMNDYISKPLRAEELDRALAHCGLLGQRTTVQALSPQEAEVLDWRQIEQLRALPGSDGNSTLLSKILKIFPDETASRIKQMQTLCEEEHWKDLSHLAHKTAGSANSIGARALEATALSIEKSISAGQLDVIPDSIRQLQRDWKLLQTQLNKINTTPNN